MSSKKISLTCSTGLNSEGEINIAELGFRSRIVKAIIYFLIGLLLAGLSILIPLLHFILPPIILISSIYIAFNKFRESKLILQGLAFCPACQEEVRLLKRRYQSQFRDFCEKCQRDLKITVKD